LSIAAQLRTAIERSLAPERLEIVDDSAKHHGHAGWRPEGETHFSVLVVSAVFAGKNRVERQRLVHAAAADLLKERIHALSLRTLTPEEAAGSAG
jgi:BolA protein